MEKDTDAGFTRLEINNGLDIDTCSDIPQNQNNSGNLLNNVSIIEVPESSVIYGRNHRNGYHQTVV